ncbi:MAG: hypothetical protein ACKO1J_00085, partial [Tagaea sp.]
MPPSSASRPRIASLRRRFTRSESCDLGNREGIFQQPVSRLLKKSHMSRFEAKMADFVTNWCGYLGNAGSDVLGGSAMLETPGFP